MPAPSVRYKILPARGDISALNAAVAAIDEGELCYALDEDKLYVKKNGSLLAVSSEAPVDSVNGQTGVVVLDADDISDVATTNKYTTQAEIDKLAGIEANAQVNTVDSVAGKTGAVTLVKADVTDFSDADYATAVQGATADSATQPGDNISTLTNDAGYITDAGVTQIVAGTNVTIDPVGGTGAVTINATGGGGGGTTIEYSGAAAWGSFESNGTFNGGLNIASITPGISASPFTGTGYLVTFTNPMPNADYAVTTTSYGTATIVVLNKTTTSFLLAGVRDTGGGATTAVGADFAVHALNALPPQGGTGADAWVLCNGDGTTQSSFNIASTTRTGLGLYDVTFTTPMPSADYSVQCTVVEDTFSVVAYNTARTVNGFSVKIANSNDQRFDFDFSAVVHATNAQLPDTVTQQQIDNVLSGTFTGSINLGAVSVFADNTAAKAGGLVDGDVYRKADGTLMIVFT